MKVAYQKGKQKLPTEELFDRAKEFEKQGQYQDAADTYNHIIKEEPRNEDAYDRLMIMYRKLKLPAKELAAINSGIKAFEEFYHTRSKIPSSKKINNLSKAFMKSAALVDKKGNLLNKPEPINRWLKRKVVVEKKLEK